MKLSGAFHKTYLIQLLTVFHVTSRLKVINVKVAWVRGKGHIGQGQIRIPYKGLWTQNNVKLLDSSFFTGNHLFPHRGSKRFQVSYKEKWHNIKNYWSVKASALIHIVQRLTCQIEQSVWSQVHFSQSN